MQNRLTADELRDLLAISPAVTYICEPYGSYPVIYISANVRQQMGYEPEEFLRDGDFWDNRIHPDDVSRVLQELPSLFETGHYDHEYRFLHKDGSYRWMYDELKLVRDSDGNPDKIVGYWLDITARKEAEQKVMAGQNRLIEAIEALSEGFVIYDAEDRFVACNSKYRELYTPTADMLASGLLFEDWARAYAASGQDLDAIGREEEWLEERMREHRNPMGPQEYRLADGRYIRLLEYRTSSGGTAGLRMDITESKRAEKALRESEAKARAFLESVPDAIIVHNLAGKVLRTNAQTEQMYGYSKAEFTGMGVEQLMLERFRARHVDHRAEYRANLQSREMGRGMTIVGLKKDGREFAIQVNLSSTDDTSEKLIIATVRDITDHVRIEEALRKAIREAEQANATKSRFLATASHDLRQPLQSLNLLNESLRRTVDDADAQKMLAMQREALAGMRNLLNSLLDITRLESGSAEPRFTDVRLQEIFDTVSAELGEQARAKGLNLQIEPTDAIAYTDSNLALEVIQNLIANAIRYTEKGFVQLGCTPEDDGLKIAVTDSGIGIPKDELDNIFTEFHQLERDPQERNVGLGLGLAIVQRIVAILDTGIEVETEVGKGSTFSFTLPVGKAIPAGSTSPAETAEPSTTGTVLLIDDEVAVLEASQILLEVEGYEVVAATSPPEAYAMLKDLADPPDIIVTDFHLRDDESGIDIVQAARKRTGRSIPAILVTGDTSPSVGELDIGNVEILIKPIEPDALLSMVRNLLQKL